MCPAKNLTDRPTVYVAGPYSSDPVMGTRAAIAAANAIWAAGGAPYVPHLTLLWSFISPLPYEEWLELDLIWLDRCDMLVRLPGESSGADGEVRHAEQECLPVFHSLDDCLVFLHVRADAASVKHQKLCCRLCGGCNEGWPVHRTTKFGWVHTQPGEMASSVEGGPQVWQPCLASLLRDQHGKQGRNESK